MERFELLFLAGKRVVDAQVHVQTSRNGETGNGGNGGRIIKPSHVGIAVFQNNRKDS